MQFLESIAYYSQAAVISTGGKNFHIAAVTNNRTNPANVQTHIFTVTRTIGGVF